MKGSDRRLRIQTGFGALGLGLWVWFLVTGCATGYGSIRQDPTVAREFEANQVPTGYRYYAYGFTSSPYAIAGIEPKYEIDSKFWRVIEPDTKTFAELVRFVWEDYGYTIFGADILDPAGKKIGVWYSALWNVTVKFRKDNRISLLTDHPFLGGPGSDDSYP